jgi:putative NADH-flavin reductase
MKIALIGATGFVGAKVLAEALERGHAVTALVRSPAKLAAAAGLTVTETDVTDPSQLAAAVAGHDAVISAFNARRGDPEFHAQYLMSMRAIIDGIKRSGVKRALFVGGAGSLLVAPGVKLMDTPHFLAEYKTEAAAVSAALDLVRAESELAWSFISPAPLLGPGQRTGRFRLGGDEVLMDGDKPGSISVEDLAVAIVDEIETSRHLQRRFTLAY